MIFKISYIKNKVSWSLQQKKIAAVLKTKQTPIHGLSLEEESYSNEEAKILGLSDGE